jgi:hypothetical protein
VHAHGMSNVSTGQYGLVVVCANDRLQLGKYIMYVSETDTN